MEHRASLLATLFGRTLPLIAIFAVSMLNGLYFSPLFDPVLFVIPRPMGMFFVKGQTVTFYAAGFFLWLMTLLLAGIPAAIYERVRGLQRSTPVSLAIWFLAALALSYPSLKAAAELW
jgi:hypothetical protein